MPPVFCATCFSSRFQSLPRVEGKERFFYQPINFKKVHWYMNNWISVPDQIWQIRIDRGENNPFDVL